MLVSAIENVKTAIYAVSGVKYDGKALQDMQNMYELILNHQAYMPEAFEQFVGDRGAWGKEAVGKALAEVESWSE